MDKQTILVVEDEEDIQQLVSFHLLKENFHVVCADDGNECLEKFSKGNIDLIILDIMLPGKSGLEVCKAIKNDPRGKHVPIIMLTARSEEEDIIEGLETGADDYITKPFSPKVLVARVKAHLRRKKELEDHSRQSSSKISLPMGLEINPDLFQVTLDGKELDLTISEFNILKLLALRPDRVFSRQQIIDAIRGDGYEVTARAVDVQIHGLRKKLGPAGALIETVRGVGYRFKAEDS
ncbi:MAG: response regulator transcription factor [Thermodesulfobacteria bacterium]|nr:response regulator transcription factor [Thermodesulfobacteriota bacterium]